MELILYWTVYAFFGWIVETSYCSFYEKKFVRRGFLVGPIIPIYAFGAMGVITLLAPYTNNPLLLFILGLVLTSALEYLTSYVMEKLFQMRWWDYSQERFNIKGRICLKNAIMFGILSVVVVHWIHPSVVLLVSKLSPTMVTLLSSISIVLVIADTTYSTLVSLQFNKRLEVLGDKIHEELRKSEQSLLQRFPSLKHLNHGSIIESIKQRINK